MCLDTASALAVKMRTRKGIMSGRMALKLVSFMAVPFAWVEVARLIAASVFDVR